MLGLSANKYAYLQQAFYLIIITFAVIPNKLFAPLNYSPDHSWQIALNHAVHHEYIFGREVILTYGPLGFLAFGIPLYLGKWSILLFCFLMAASMAALLWMSIRKAAVVERMLLLFIGLFTAKIWVNDPSIFLFLLGILVLIAQLERPAVATAYLLGVMAAFALFMKLNTALVFFAVVFPVMMYWGWQRKVAWYHIGLSLLAALSLVALLAITFRVEMVPYLKSARYFIDSYNDAMLIPLPDVPLTLLPAGMIFMLAVLLMWYMRHSFSGSGAFLLFIFLCAAFLFVAFKQGFVRSHPNHQITFFGSAPYLFIGCAIFLPDEGKWLLSIRLACMAGICSVLTLFCLGEITILARPLRDLYMDEPIRHRIMPEAIKQRIGNHTVDIMPMDIDKIHFSGLHLVTRPIAQSYMAHHPVFDSINAAHFASPRAPEYLLFINGSIDNRHPFFDESITKLSVARHYHLVDSLHFQNETEDYPGQKVYYLLQKRKDTLPDWQVVKRQSLEVALNRRIPVPASDHPVMFKADVTYTPWNQLRRLLFQPMPLQCRLYYADGTHSEHFLPLPLLKAGIMVNKRLLSYREAGWFFGTGIKPVQVTAIELVGTPLWFKPAAASFIEMVLK